MPEGNRRIGAEVFIKATEARDTLRSVKDDVSALGSEAEKASNRASTAMNGVASSAKATAAALGATSTAANGAAGGLAPLLTRQQQLSAESAKLTQGIGVLQRALERTPAAASVINPLLEQMAVRKNEVTQESLKLGNQIKTTNENMGKTGGIVGVLQSILTAHTTQISSQGTAWAGADSAMQAATRALGGVTIATSLGLTAIGLLIPVVYKLITGKRELAEITKDLVEKDIALANAFSHLVSNGNDVDGSLRRQAESYKKILAADISALLTVYVAQFKRLTTAQDEQKQSNDRVTQAQAAYNAALEQNNKIAQGTLPLTGEVGAMVDFYRQSTEKATEAQGKQNKEVAGTIDALKAMHQAGVITTEGMYAMARSAGAEADALARLRAELENTKTAEDKFFDSLAKQDAGFATQSTNAGLIQQMINIGANLEAVMKIPGETFRTAVLSQQGELEKFKKTIQGMTLTQAGYNAFVADLPKLLRDALGEVQAIDRGMKNLADNTKQAEAAARSLESFISQLRQKADTAAAKTGDDSFEKQIAIVQAASAKLYRELAAMRDKDAVQHIIASDLIIKIEKHALTEIQNKRIAALVDVEDRLKKIRAAGVLDEIERHKQEIETKLSADNDYLRKLGFSEQEAKEKLIRFRQAREEEYFRWLNDEYTKFTVKALDAERNLAGEIFKIREKLFADIQKSNVLWWRQQTKLGVDTVKEQVKVMNELVNHFARGGAAGPKILDPFLLAKVVLELDRLGVSWQHVDRVFGSASRTLEQLNRRMQILYGDMSTGQRIVASFSDSMQSFQADWIESGAIFQLVADGIASSMEAMEARGEDFGANMKAMFLDMVAQIAAYFGRLFISMGAGMLFVNPAAGIGLIAAGTALMALSGVFAGLASKAHEAARASGSSASAAAGGSASTGAATGGTRTQHPPNVIPFPTSGSSSAVTFDASDTNQLVTRLLAKHQVITVPTSKNKHRPALKQAVGG
ncbi:MAG: hypothetical protein WBV94_09740 [Blastocatellia bacterium]